MSYATLGSMTSSVVCIFAIGFMLDWYCDAAFHALTNTMTAAGHITKAYKVGAPLQHTDVHVIHMDADMQATSYAHSPGRCHNVMRHCTM